MHKIPKNKKVLLLLATCTFFVAVGASALGVLIGKTSVQPAPPPVAISTISKITSQISAAPTAIPALSMFGHDFPSDKFTCHGFSWRYDCFMPWNTRTPFQFNDSNKLTCVYITDTWFASSPYSKVDGLQLKTEKKDQNSYKFSLERNGNTVRKPIAGDVDHDTQTPYTIIADNYETLILARPSRKLDMTYDEFKSFHDLKGVKTLYNDTTVNYDIIILSKKDGKGIEVWRNLYNPNISSWTFQCRQI